MKVVSRAVFHAEFTGIVGFAKKRFLTPLRHRTDFLLKRVLLKRGSEMLRNFLSQSVYQIDISTWTLNKNELQLQAVIAREALRPRARSQRARKAPMRYRQEYDEVWMQKMNVPNKYRQLTRHFIRNTRNMLAGEVKMVFTDQGVLEEYSDRI